MHLKEVEKLTGLSSKAIRLYEEKGLIAVERQLGNDYRVYSPDNVQTLRKIKILRYLDFSIQEIKVLLEASDEDMLARLKEKEQSVFQQEEVLTDKLNILKEVRTSLKKGSDWADRAQEGLNFLESDLSRDIKDYLLPSFWGSLGTTFLYSGPILWLFTRISQGRTEDLSLLAGLSLLLMIPITLTWRTYLTTWLKNREVLAQKNRRSWLGVLLFILSLVFGIGSFILVDWLIKISLLPAGWLFYEGSHGWGRLMIFGIICPLYLIFEYKTNFWKLNLSYKWAIGAFLIILLSIVAYVESVWVVTPESIQNINLLRPHTVYSYEAIEKVEAKFGNKRFTLNETDKRGQFSYSLHLDGKMISFMSPSVNQELVKDDSYIELEDFDQVLMTLGIAKDSSAEFSQYNDLAPYFTERFLRIIRNQPD